jgi:hypothetical protein
MIPLVSNRHRDMDQRSSSTTAECAFIHSNDSSENTRIGVSTPARLIHLIIASTARNNNNNNNNGQIEDANYTRLVLTGSRICSIHVIYIWEGINPLDLTRHVEYCNRNSLCCFFVGIARNHHNLRKDVRCQIRSEICYGLTQVPGLLARVCQDHQIVGEIRRYPRDQLGCAYWSQRLLRRW